MTTVYACFILTFGYAIGDPHPYPKWIWQELRGEHEMRLFAEHLEASDLVLDWQCRGYRVTEKEGLA